MPEITVNMAAGRTDEQKAGMMRDITAALVNNLGVDADAVERAPAGDAAATPPATIARPARNRWVCRNGDDCIRGARLRTVAIVQRELQGEWRVSVSPSVGRRIQSRL